MMAKHLTFAEILEAWSDMYAEAKRHSPGWGLLLDDELINRLAEPTDEQGTLVFEGLNMERTRRQIAAAKPAPRMEVTE